MVGSNSRPSKRGKTEGSSSILPLNFLRKTKAKAKSPPNISHSASVLPDHIDKPREISEDDVEGEGEGYMVEHDELDYPEEFSKGLEHESVSSLVKPIGISGVFSSFAFVDCIELIDVVL